MRLAVAATSLLALGATAKPTSAKGEAASIREYFYAGGSYADDGKGGHIFKDQAYVEHLTPVSGATKRYPIVFIHGQAQTGTNWLNKPDGGSGWASYFLSKGYEIYIVDQTYRGRSPFFPGNGTLSTYSAELLQQRFTAPQQYNLWPQASLHTQWSGTGVMGDTVFDAYYSSTVQFLSGAVQQQTTVQTAGAALLDRIGKPVILVGHSQGGIMPWLIADVRPKLVHAIISIEPSGPPFKEAVFSSTAARAYGLSDAPLTYYPAVTNASTDLVTKTIISTNTSVSNCTIQADANPRKLVNLAKVPVLLVTSESSYHVPYDWCTVQYLQQAGVSTTHLKLGEHGIHGNGHMMFLEKNSDKVANLIQKSVERL